MPDCRTVEYTTTIAVPPILSFEIHSTVVALISSRRVTSILKNQHDLSRMVSTGGSIKDFPLTADRSVEDPRAKSSDQLAYCRVPRKVYHDDNIQGHNVCNLYEPCRPFERGAKYKEDGRKVQQEYNDQRHVRTWKAAWPKSGGGHGSHTNPRLKVPCRSQGDFTNQWTTTPP
ncbi:hypothetical protein PoB_002883100 [Plakobranchus ocellatus]|uniref:Uncharacterized protein n=1 Tax=Plakobranchus ocellatus TaxID=259542 RepID=A0AAV4A6N5_9GAST|nr:hypothetical protein PoB_002883100 [Plakobranchus ocellatus]